MVCTTKLVNTKGRKLLIFGFLLLKGLLLQDCVSRLIWSSLFEYFFSFFKHFFLKFDLTGTEMDLKDCETFYKYEQFPPTYVLRYHGINPVVSLLLKILRCQPIQLSQSCFYSRSHESWILNYQFCRDFVTLFSNSWKKIKTDKTNANMNFFFKIFVISFNSN